VLALIDRADAIEQRARELATIAIEHGDAWVQNFGDAPPTGELYEQWLLEVATGAAYFDRWRIGNPDTLLDDALVSHEQEAQRRRAQDVAQRARTLSVVEDLPEKPTYVLSGDEFLNLPTLEFGLDR
jgi:hypothetical protein